MNCQLAHRMACRPASLLFPTCTGNVESAPVPWRHEAPCRLRTAGSSAICLRHAAFSVNPFSSLDGSSIQQFQEKRQQCTIDHMPVFHLMSPSFWSVTAGFSLRSALPGGLFGLLFSCSTGECLSRPTPRKLTDSLLPCLLICLPDNPRTAGTLSFPPRAHCQIPSADSQQLQLLWRGLPL